MIRLISILLLCSAAFGQAPPITGLVADSVTSTSGRMLWTAGFYRDTATDVTLTSDYTTSGFSSDTLKTVTVSSDANMRGWLDGYSASALIIGGTDWARVKHVHGDGHTIDIEAMTNSFIGPGGWTENYVDMQNGLSVSISGGVATATYPFALAAYIQPGTLMNMRYIRGSTLDNIGPVLSRPDDTHITFSIPCSPTCDGTHNYANDADVYLAPWWGQTHHSGETISFLATDAKVCYGDPGGPSGTYGHTAYVDYDPGTALYPQAAQSSKHFAYLFGQTPGSRIYFKVLSTPRQIGTSDCSSPGAHTGQSAEQHIDFPSSEATDPIPPSGVSFSLAPPTTSVTVLTYGGTNCTTLFGCIVYARSHAGNWEIRLPAGGTVTVPSGGITIPPQTAGSLITTLRTSADDSALPTQGVCLPPTTPGLASPCINNASYAASLATITNTDVSAMFRSGDWSNASGFHFGPGIKVEINSGLASRANAGVIYLQHASSLGQLDHTAHTSDFIVDRCYFHQKNISNGYTNILALQGGERIAFIDNVVEGFGTHDADLGAVTLQAKDLTDCCYVIQNNRIEAAFNAFYAMGEGYNPHDGVIKNNWITAAASWHPNRIESFKQVQLPVTSVTAGSTTTITVSEPTEFALGWDLSTTYVSVVGAVGTGTWESKLNAREFSMVAGTLDDFSCAAGNCIATTHAAHGYTTGDYLAFGNLLGYPCRLEVGAHQITVIDSTHVSYASSTSANCGAFDATIMGPVFHPSTDATSVVIPLNSTGFPTATGTMTLRYGIWINRKNGIEFKSGERWVIRGNLIEKVWTDQQNAAGIVVSNRAAGAYEDASNVTQLGTTSDFYIHDNWLREVGMAFGFIGVQDNGTSVPTTRMKYANNLISNSDPLVCTGFENCNKLTIGLSNATNVKLDHNTALNDDLVFAAGSSYASSGLGTWSLTNSIQIFGEYAIRASDYLGVNHEGAKMWQSSGTCSTGPCADSMQVFAPDASWNWERNAIIAHKTDEGAPEDTWYRTGNFWGYYAGSGADWQKNYWLQGLPAMGWAGAYAVTNATNATPIVLTVATMGCVPDPGDRYWVGGVKGNWAANGKWSVKGATSTSLTLVGSAGNAAYTATTGMAIPISGKCDVADNWALGSSSNYRASSIHHVPDDPNLATPFPSYPFGQGPANDSTDVGVDVTALKLALGGTSGPSCTYSIDTSAHTFLAAGGTQSITITTDSGCSWGVTYPDSWMSGPPSGTGTQTIIVTAAANGGALRTSNLTVAGNTFAATQSAGSGCTFSLDISSHTYPAAGAAQSVSITASDSSCAWTASYPDGWLSGSTSGTGSSTISITASANVGSLRTSTATIAGQAYVATQDAPVITSTPGMSGVHVVGARIN